MNGVTVTDNNIHIENSFVVERKKYMLEMLKEIKQEYPECKTFKRSQFSILSEWRAHNMLFRIGFFPSHTKDVDLNYNEKWYRKFLYYIIGTIYFIIYH